MGFNLSHRIILFSICSSIEYDIRQVILNGENITIPQPLIDKANDRSKNQADTLDKILNELDLGDYIEIIKLHPYNFKLNNHMVEELSQYFNKIIPIRNRVMHTRPLEIGDRAILFEVINSIDESIQWMDWKETKCTKLIIEDNPTKLFENGKYYQNNFKDKVYHNLPEPEFDDTGYIGRKKEIKELQILLKNNKHQIISIIGNGGLGKTALTVKILYDLLDDPDSTYEAILWITLKTRTLSNGEFNALQVTIKAIPELFEAMQSEISTQENISAEDEILEFLGTFKTLLVLDNLETINTEEIMSFLKKVPEKSKVLITSRHGLGELENRYSLEGLTKQDAISYYRELSKYYGLDLHKSADKEIQEIVEKHLYSNPLSIKWFITSVYKGIHPNSLIHSKGDLIEFCMSNVYEKLSSDSKLILCLFLVEKYDLTIGEIDFFLEIDPVNLRQAINEMLSTNMVKLKSGSYILNEMAKDYLSKYYPPEDKFFLEINKKRKELNALLQTINTLKENDPYHPKSLSNSMTSKDKKIATYYLHCALMEKSLAKSRVYLEKAMNVAPDYFEVYKIQAFIEAKYNNIFKAEQNYDIALEKCDNNEDRARILLLYATFYVLKVEDYPQALSIVDKANELAPKTIEILLEKTRILMRMGRFKDCFDILKEIEELDVEHIEKKRSLLSKSYAEVYRRKAETISIKDDPNLKIDLLQSAINEIEKLESLDRKNGLTMLATLADLSYLALNNRAMELLSRKLFAYIDSLKWINSNDFQKIKRNIDMSRHEIKPEYYDKMKTCLVDYRILAKEIMNSNEGIVVALLERGIGFIANAQNKELFFHVNNLIDKVEVGDFVQFETYKNKKGVAATKIRQKNPY